MSDESNAQSPMLVRVGGFTLDLERQRLSGASGPLDLRPKCFEALRYLVEHAGQVVSKDELLDAVWPHVTVSAESLSQCISEIRRAIGDEHRQIIKTIARRGYLFDMPEPEGQSTIERIDFDTPEAGTRNAHMAPRTRSRLVRWIPVSAAGAGLVAIAVFVNVTKSQDIHSAWDGSLNCDKLPTTSGPLLAGHFEVTVHRNNAVYNRTVYTSDRSGVIGIESGAGSVSEGGLLELTGHVHPVPVGTSQAYYANYKGRLASPSTTLHGRQYWQIDGVPYVRNCTVLLERRKQS